MGSHNISTVNAVRVCDYFVRDDGMIWSIRRGRFLSSYKTNKGCPCVTFNGTKRTVHRIVAETFLPNKDGLPTVNHKNGDRTDNRISNLEWCSYAANNQHAWDTGHERRRLNLSSKSTGSKNRQSKLTEAAVIEIRNRFIPNTKGMRAVLANEFGVSVGAIKQVVAGTSWKHV